MHVSSKTFVNPSTLRLSQIFKAIELLTLKRKKLKTDKLTRY